jgi:hypothetical protein
MTPKYQEETWQLHVEPDGAQRAVVAVAPQAAGLVSERRPAVVGPASVVSSRTPGAASVDAVPVVAVVPVVSAPGREARSERPVVPVAPVGVGPAGRAPDLHRRVLASAWARR